jgi:hypothetical protein
MKKAGQTEASARDAIKKRLAIEKLVGNITRKSNLRRTARSKHS